jgi:hypothetical protein
MPRLYATLITAFAPRLSATSWSLKFTSSMVGVFHAWYNPICCRNHKSSRASP